MKTGFKKADIIVFSLFFAVLVFSILLVIASRQFGSYAVVTVDGEQTDVLPIHKDGKYQVNNGTNTVVIEKGQVWVVEADCPDKLCEKIGKIMYDGQSIICLPNKLTVTISGKANEVDFVI